MTSRTEQGFQVKRTGSYWTIGFSAMAGPCEILVRCKTKSEANHLASLSYDETKRIEKKFSRYRNDNVVHRINNSNGASLDLDEEFQRLLNYADECYQLSSGLFDITSGVLRKAWRFDGTSFNPDTDLIQSLLELVGWDKVEWNGKTLRLLPGMEIDFGGIGKEYAVDLVAEMLYNELGVPLMVNFGGDIRAIDRGNGGQHWVVGIEDPSLESSAVGQIDLLNGGIATSGDLRRFCLVDGIRLGHILNPKTGWPVANAPRSVTLLGDYCIEAGFLSTLTLLQGENAEQFIREQSAIGHCIR